MALLSIDSWQPFPDANGYSATNTELRVWYNRPFLDSDGVSVQSGNGVQGFYITASVSFAASTPTINTFDLRTTLDAIDPAPQSIQVFARLFSNNAPKAWIFAGNDGPNGWVIPNPDPLTTMTYEDLAIYNQTTVLANPPQTFWTAAQTQAYFDSLSPAPDASTITKGIAFASFTPFTPTSPTFISDSDPRVGSWFNILSYGAATTNTAAQNAVAIGLAITAATTAGGGIYIPVGTFLTNSVMITVPVMFAPGGSILETSQTVQITKAISADISKHFGGAGTFSFSGNTSISAVYPQWWTANTTPGTTDMGTAITAAGIAAGTANAPVVFTEGTYAYAVAPTFGNYDNFYAQALGTVIFKHTGSGTILSIREATGAFIYNVRILGNFQIYGNVSSAASGVIIEGLKDGKVQLDGRGAPSAMFTCKGLVVTECALRCSTNGPGFLGPTPITGVVITSGNANTTDSNFHLTIEGVSGTGISLVATSGCQLDGTSESNGTGLTEDSMSRRNTYIGLDFEANTVLDIQLNGVNGVFLNCYVNSGVINPNVTTDTTTQNATFIGGILRSINLDASSHDTAFINVEFPTTAGLGILGTGTRRTLGCAVVDGSVIWQGNKDDVLARLVTRQSTPATATVTATLSVTQLKTGIIKATPPALGATCIYVLPTGPNMDETGSVISDDDSFLWSLINLAAAALDTATIQANTAHTFIGPPIIQSANGNAIGSAALFRSRRISAGVWETYRIS